MTGGRNNSKTNNQDKKPKKRAPCKEKKPAKYKGRTENA